MFPSSLPKQATLESLFRFRQYELWAFAKAYFGKGHISRVAELAGVCSMSASRAFSGREVWHKYDSLSKIEVALRSLGFVSGLDRSPVRKVAFPRLSKRNSTKVSPERQRRMGFHNAVLPGPDVVVVQQFGQS